MRHLLHENLILVLFLVIGIGYVLGRIRIGNFSLGVSAVLFVGLAISAWDPQLALPQIVYVLGLVLFVYTIGLSSGAGFFSTLRKRGLRETGFALAVLLVGGATAAIASLVLDVPGPLAAGTYAGAVTNTPALAAVLESLGNSSVAPVIGYSLAYPLGVLCVLAVIAVFERAWHITYQRTASNQTAHDTLFARTIRVTRTDAPPVGVLAAAAGADVKVSRIRIGDRVRLVRPDDRLTSGTLVTVVGEPASLEKAADWLGEPVTGDGLELDRRVIDSRRVFLSNTELAGRSVGSLDVRDRYGVLVTRIRRGDVDMVAHSDSTLELGDRIRIVGPRQNLEAAATYFGDSYRRASELDILTFTLGIGLGLLAGMIPVPLPGGSTFHLGAAGGTLLVALVLGAVGRSGRALWQLPFSTNMALRQIGVVLFLAGIGTQAGGALGKALANPSSLLIIGIGAVVTTLVSVATLVVGHRVLHIPFGRLIGMLASIQTQPAVLAFANERCTDEAPNLGYAAVYPVAMIAKIVIAQLILMILR